jgi:hypothetical protein
VSISEYHRQVNQDGAINNMIKPRGRSKGVRRSYRAMKRAEAEKRNAETPQHRTRQGRRALEKLARHVGEARELAGKGGEGARSSGRRSVRGVGAPNVST